MDPEGLLLHSQEPATSSYRRPDKSSLSHSTSWRSILISFDHPSFFNNGARWRWMINATHQPLYSQERDPLSIVQDAGSAPRLVWTLCQISSPLGFHLRAFQSIVYRYTDYENSGPSLHTGNYKSFCAFLQL